MCCCMSHGKAVIQNLSENMSFSCSPWLFNGRYIASVSHRLGQAFCDCNNFWQKCYAVKSCSFLTSRNYCFFATGQKQTTREWHVYLLMTCTTTRCLAFNTNARNKLICRTTSIGRSFCNPHPWIVSSTQCVSVNRIRSIIRLIFTQAENYYETWTWAALVVSDQ